MSLTESGVQNVTNYLIPASGQTHAVTYAGTFSATPAVIDWRQFAINNFPFQPQGLFADNTQGTAPLVITIGPIGYKVVVAAGTSAQAQFPAPNGQTASITGDGEANITFVDFPVLPGSGAVSIQNTVNAQIVGPDPLPVLPGPNSAGVAYQNTEIPAPVTAYYASIAAGATSATIMPTVAGANLRKLLIDITANATLAAAGTTLLTVRLNGITIYERNIYILNAIRSTQSSYRDVLDFSKLGLAAQSGALIVSLATALATGVVDINAYFG